MRRLMILVLMFVAGGLLTGKSFGVSNVKTINNAHHDTIESISFSPDGKILVSGSYDEGEDERGIINLWDTTTWKRIKIIQGYNKVSFSPDGKTMAALSSDLEDASIALLDVPTGNKIKTFSIKTFSHDLNPITESCSLALSPDGKLLAAGCTPRWSEVGHIVFWDVKTGNMIKELLGHEFGINSIAFSPDGKLLASGGWGYKNIILWDVKTGVRIRELHRNEDNHDPTNSVTFSPDGKLLAAGGSDYSIALWDVSTGKNIKTLVGHSDSVKSVVFSPDGKMLASGSSDKTIILWDMVKGNKIKTIAAYKPVHSVIFSPDGKMLVSGEGESWRVSEERFTTLSIRDWRSTPGFEEVKSEQ
ncbi:MAG: WD40 repeat domain-containing protein [Nitrospinota bacterium]